MKAFYNPQCFLAQNGVMSHGDPMPSCDGRLVRVHLIPRTKLKQVGHDTLDPRSYVPGCGGIMGNAGHHGMLDFGMRPLTIPRSKLPPELLELAEEIGMEWWIERTYG